MFKSSRRAGEQTSTKMFFATSSVGQDGRSGGTSGSIFTTAMNRADMDEIRKAEEMEKIRKKIEAIYEIFDENKEHDIGSIVGYLRRGVT